MIERYSKSQRILKGKRRHNEFTNSIRLQCEVKSTEMASSRSGTSNPSSLLVRNMETKRIRENERNTKPHYRRNPNTTPWDETMPNAWDMKRYEKIWKDMKRLQDVAGVASRPSRQSKNNWKCLPNAYSLAHRGMRKWTWDYDVLSGFPSAPAVCSVCSWFTGLQVRFQKR
jgi:hypothetical protein